MWNCIADINSYMPDFQLNLSCSKLILVLLNLREAYRKTNEKKNNECFNTHFVKQAYCEVANTFTVMPSFRSSKSFIVSLHHVNRAQQYM